MPKLPFSRLFQLSSCLMGGLLTLKIYLLSSSLLFANTPEMTAKQAAKVSSTATGAPQEANVPVQTADGSTPVVQSPAGAKAGDGKVAATPSSPCGDKPCIGQENRPDLDVDHRSDSARNEILTDLAGRTKELDQESQRLTDLKKAIDASQAILDARMQKYTQEQTSRAGETKRLQQLGDADLDRLVKIYEAMAPRDAASIFNVLDPRVLVPVMGRMNPRKASAILASMSPERATVTTQLLAGLPRKPVVARVETNG
ncbi:hypothetical protein AA0472_2070 [Acetobacter estunensis NRIC 0472]|uniref:Magnesium transporter MgtE intracellular domain-containing protein n=1 Tax=Acetobacter estunensis TaxID=104097 RepID=A0A967EAN4_9PROT|nr:MotE family protein [Acetobacter estunensis]NHO52553.1 hypothetical protein [Acetobacter estunensis]GBQ26303.1 hypothetical protein AA0472_2070 [Acetobacter estunensis NRIC 0472]